MYCGDDAVIGDGRESKSPATGVKLNEEMLCSEGSDGTDGADGLYLTMVLRKLL